MKTALCIYLGAGLAAVAGFASWIPRRNRWRVLLFVFVGWPLFWLAAPLKCQRAALFAALDTLANYEPQEGGAK